ncbi:MAG TPA: hypothetical protein VEG30_17855 [Terriglobales bacterium]|nr:hypothetical protein [Terriglobales bacterium]
MRIERMCCSLAAFALFAGITLAQTSTPTQPAPKPVRASGCTRAGVESGCVVLEDFNDKKLYNLLFPADAKQPAMGVAISFTGTEHQGMTTCMQGTAVNVTKWKRLKKSCAEETDNKH